MLRWLASRLNSVSTSPSPTQAFELQEGRGAVTGPLRLIAEREAVFLPLSLSPPPSAPFTWLSLFLFVFLSPHSIATNYSFSCLLLLIRVFFFNILADHRNHKKVRGERQSTQIFDRLIMVPVGNIDMQGDSVQRHSKDKHEHKVVTPTITTW